MNRFRRASSMPRGRQDVQVLLPALAQRHRRFDGSVEWALRPGGLTIDGGEPRGAPGEPITVRRVWDEYGESVSRWGEHFGVPLELIIATICTESGGRRDAIREEPGYRSDVETPHRVSAGLTQTLISTARETLGLDSVDREWLLEPDNAIRAGTAYIARQSRKTRFDPPVVACAYNAGGVYHNRSEHNRWRMRQYPLGTGEHADRFVAWFNDCFRVLEDRRGPDHGPFLAGLTLHGLVRNVTAA